LFLIGEKSADGKMDEKTACVLFAAGSSWNLKDLLRFWLVFTVSPGFFDVSVQCDQGGRPSLILLEGKYYVVLQIYPSQLTGLLKEGIKMSEQAISPRRKE
jgi:hypothetical protein